MTAAVPVVDLAALLPSWKLALQADRKSRQTVDAYTTGVRLFLEWCDEHGHAPVLDRSTVRTWITDLLNGGAAPATARTRQMALKRYSAWLLEEDEIEADLIRDVSPPKLDVKVVEGLTDEQCAALVKACQGKEFIDRRDEAVARLLIETGMRAGEVLGLAVADVDVQRGLAVVRRGKGGKGRVVPFGPQVARSIDRYLRTRRTHRLAHTETLWLGGGGQQFRYHGLDRAMKARADAAGIYGFHLHLLRNTAATRWLAAGGSENGLMAVAGWSSREMLDRYTRASASDRAAAEARGLNLGDLGV
ncbi:tyrosine-type recombinase/integrase [Mycolicibacterium arenosum]|uniref:Tyrosine-type recombinase/integrase n=1 Tax=Mycolicibacterium arenosum TaxID=2952157 RepID=A0ABT1M0Y4_9MYCO|nr:tyrosine-type recombinase/integrase [Mycolicibacterium sp. CAU 1645]MCP9272781.1 tyrosine-type recombinase/integrase [Mycolicibacterium sp. CAU 1645]